MVSTGTSLSGESFSDFVGGSVNGPLEDVSFQADLSLEDRLEEISTRVDLMLSCYVNNMRSEFEVPVMALQQDHRKSGLLDYNTLWKKINWLKEKYDPIHQRILDGEIPVEDDDFETIITSNEILYDQDGEFVLIKLYHESNLGKNDEKLDEMETVFSNLFNVADKGGRFRMKIRDYIYNYLTLLNVDPREQDQFENDPPVQYASTVEKYELAMIKEFVRFGDVPKRLKDKYGINDTRTINVI